ncbi:TIGR03087 family PEP-CTERM/XrtA system glycosyltransferase [Pontixanthobacter luteolus]|uniref:TIGR03087 family PEP-CTERM/XrtA system glycosyltransferase n=1 Tax=Pontixanthobacter luteolus TaxID=295089 RepID=UPI002304CA62|nr:TIGR03087 family PEP-CTERM/XrtA system glycosyltransferase [Pontixanthobacter luteolus]
MGDILFLAHRMPFPPDRGDKIRSHHLLKALAELSDVHVGCFGDTDSDFSHEGELAATAKSHCLVRRSKSMAFSGIEALASGKPVSLTAFAHKALSRWVASTIEQHPIDTIFVFSGQMGQFIPDSFKGRVIVDLCDVDSAKFEAYAKEGSVPRKWIDAREGRKLSAVEEALAHRADATLFVSQAEADLFRSRLRNSSCVNIAAIRNGIDTTFFDPSAVTANAELARVSGPNFVFTGQMDYAPNIAAAERVIAKLLPAIRQKHPGAAFHVVGRAPTDRLMRHDGKAGVKIWGEVPDVRPFLAAADVVIAPLEIARGIQNKVLEAMAMARPVLLSAEAATGIDASDGKHFRIGTSNDALIAAALDMLANPAATAEMASAAREYVAQHQSWPAMLAPLSLLCEVSAQGKARDAA